MSEGPAVFPPGVLRRQTGFSNGGAGSRARRRTAVCGLLAALIAPSASIPAVAQSSSRLFFLEVQGIMGYSSAEGGVVFDSVGAMEEMQKPSVGFDYVQRFSSETRDVAVVSVQGRLAVSEEDGVTLQPQLYNCYVKFKSRPADVWVGHSRPAFGLSSYVDSHALLLQPLSMQGFGYSLDWGAGVGRDFSWGTAGASLTAGSGMPLDLRGNWLLSGRVGKGVLSRDNYTVGVSGAWGRVLDTMGYHVVSPGLTTFAMVSADVSWLWDNVENRAEFMAGKKGGRAAWAAFARSGVNLLGEGRLKLEIQPVATCESGETLWRVAGGVTYQTARDVAFRGMVQYDEETRDTRVVFQVYLYKNVLF